VDEVLSNAKVTGDRVHGGSGKSEKNNLALRRFLLVGFATMFPATRAVARYRLYNILTICYAGYLLG